MWAAAAIVYRWITRIANAGSLVCEKVSSRKVRG